MSKKKFFVASTCILSIACLLTLTTSSISASAYTPTLQEKSAYRATPVQDVSNSMFTIHQYNSETGIIDAINYELGLKKTEYGSGNASKTYSIGVLENYNIDITGKYSSENLGDHIYIKSKDYSSTNYTSDYVEMSKATVWSSYAFGGAITNLMGQMGDISGIFIGNSAVTDKKQAWAGAILARGTTGDITADFIGNFADSSITEASGGAIAAAQYNIESITGDFIGNYAKGELTSGGFGGGLYIVNNSVIKTVTSNFIANSARSETAGAYAGAVDIYRNSKIENLTGDFIGNYADGYREAYAGAIEIVGSADYITGDFIANYAKSKNGIALAGAVEIMGTVGDITGNFISNYAKSENDSAFGGAFYTEGSLNNLKGDFFSNYATSEKGNAYGGAIYSSDAIIDEIDSSFYGNYATSENGTALGGAIYTNNDLNFSADNKTIAFAENYTESNGVRDDNAVYVDNADATLTFNLKNNGNLLIKDNFNGQIGYNVNIIGDGTNTLFLQNDLNNADVLFNNIMLNTIDGKSKVYNFNSLSIANNINFIADVDFQKEEMDRFYTNDSYNIQNGSQLNINALNFLNEQKKDKVSIFFAEKGLKDNVVYSGTKKIVTPIYVYDIAYENKDDAGYFVFTRGSASNGVSGYNPATLVSETNSTVGAIGTMNQAMTYAFVHSDTSMNIPSAIRIGMKNQNKYASASLADISGAGRFSPLYLPSNEGASFWVKPYAVFENVPLKNGPKVSNISYGTYIGFDTDIKELRRGWQSVYTGYIGYNGASQRYSGIDTVQNGGLLGGTLTLYKGNFFNATTLSVGSNVSDSQTMYGHDDYATLLSGIGNKTGYNIEFKDGKVILQPNLLLSYTFINTFDYTNSAGVNIDNKPLHSLQIVPGFKIIGNLNNGWQPYLSVSMNWNPLMGAKTKANNIELPKTEIKPYVQYGVGVQKTIKDNLTAYGQAMVQNGGRNGVSLTAGIRWLLGSKKEKQEKEIITTSKKVFKKLSQEEKEKIIKKEYDV